MLEPGDDVLALGLRAGLHRPRDPAHRGSRRSLRARPHDGMLALRAERTGAGAPRRLATRRAVPVEARLPAAGGPRPPLPRFLDDVAIERLLARGDLEFRRDLLPLVAKEVGWAYYHELFHAHPERTAAAWDDFAERVRRARLGAVDSTRSWRRTVPRPEDRLDLIALDRPLAGLRFGSAERAPPPRRAPTSPPTSPAAPIPTHSADLGAFMGLLTSFGALGPPGTGRLSPRSRVEDFGRLVVQLLHVLRQRAAAAQRLRQLLALADAGLVRFLGAGTTVAADPSKRTLRGPQREPSRRRRRRRFLVDARIATPSVSRSTDAMLRRLHERGEVVEEVVPDGAAGRSTPARSSSPAPTCGSSGATAPPSPTPRARRVHQPPCGRQPSPGPARTRPRSARTTPSPGASSARSPDVAARRGTTARRSSSPPDHLARRAQPDVRPRSAPVVVLWRPPAGSG